MELESLRSNNSFELLWTETEEFALKEDISPSSIPRARKIPSRLGSSEVVTATNIALHFKVNTYFPVLDIIINDIKSKSEENNLKILNALQSCLSARTYSDENILEVCNIYDLREDDLKAELKIFGKMCLLNNISKSFENHLTFS